MSKKIILFAGGGSGGHIYPLVAVLEKLKRRDSEDLPLEIRYLGPVDEFSATLYLKHKIKTYGILAPKFRRYFSILNIFDFFKFFLALFQALVKLFFIMPDVIFSKGGPGALAIVLVGRFYRIPVVIHESDAAPGLTNMLSARFSKRIAVGFERAVQYFDPAKTIFTGNPVREELLEDLYSGEIAKDELHFDTKEPLVLFLGGSQGSRRINEFVLENLTDLLKLTQVIHQTGTDQFLEVQQLSRAALLDLSLTDEIKHPYQVQPYFSENLKTVFLAADLIVARAGAGTIFEIAAFAKPAILIPLPESANDHQRVNAFEFSKSGGGVVIEEENLFKGIFMNQLSEILKNSNKFNQMSAASGKFFKPNAAELIAQEIISCLKM